MTTIRSTVTDEPDLVTIIQAYNDVTERLKRSHEALAREVCRLSEELQDKNKELQRRERLAALGEMAAGVAHEIRNPLGGIGLYASLLERDLADMPRQQDLVRRMTAGLKNLESIVNDILAFACDAEPRQERILLGKVLQAVLIQTTPQAEALNVRIEVGEKLASIALRADAAQLERALINLVFNAVDAAGTDRDDAGGRVWIRCGKEDRDNGLFRLIVEDNGPGITPELRHRIFDPFFTTKHTGTGLGLAIVHRIAESNEGSVSAGCAEAGGARFVLSLPLAREDAETESAGGIR
jgi:signal transduction histidine kinase